MEISTCSQSLNSTINKHGDFFSNSNTRNNIFISFQLSHELSKLKLPEFMEHGSEKSQEIFWIKLPHNLFYST